MATTSDSGVTGSLMSSPRSVMAMHLQSLDFKGVPVSRIMAEGLRLAAWSNHVEVTIGAFAHFGIVVIKSEGNGFRVAAGSKRSRGSDWPFPGMKNQSGLWTYHDPDP